MPGDHTANPEDARLALPGTAGPFRVTPSPDDTKVRLATLAVTAHGRSLVADVHDVTPDDARLLAGYLLLMAHEVDDFVQCGPYLPTRDNPDLYGHSELS